MNFEFIFSNFPLKLIFSRIGGSIPVTWSYFAEFQPKDRRGSMLSFLAAFWMIGNMLVAGKIAHNRKNTFDPF